MAMFVSIVIGIKVKLEKIDKSSDQIMINIIQSGRKVLDFAIFIIH